MTDLERIRTIQKLIDFKAEKTAILKQAETILNHRFTILSKKISFGKKIDWHSNFSDQSWPVDHFKELVSSTLVYNSPRYIGDVKLPWELSKHIHLQVLAAAYKVKQDERYSKEFVSEINDWIDKNPYEQGVNWAHGLVVGQRAISWILAAGIFKDSQLIDENFSAKFQKSIHEHSIYLDKNYEICARSTNHLLGELSASIIINTVFDWLPGAKARLERAKSLLENELEKQIYPDGVSYEQSTSYQRFIFEFLVLILLLEKEYKVNILTSRATREKIEKMADFLKAMRQPSGLMQPISDVDSARVIWREGNIDDPEPILKLGGFKISTSESKAFPAGGYWISQSPLSWLFFDCGYMGMGKWPKDLPLGVHGHSDTLNFGLAIGKETFITDGGSYSYTTERSFHQYFRSSLAHNVPIIDGQDENIILNSPWLSKQQALPQNPRHYFTNACDYIAGEHTGYHRLHGRITVRREIMHSKKGGLVIIKDSFLGGRKHKINELFHLMPGLKIQNIDGGYKIIGKKNKLEIKALFDCKKSHVAGKTRPVDGWYSPNFGEKIPAPVLKFDFEVEAPISCYFSVCWGKKTDENLIDVFEQTLLKIKKPKALMLVTNDLSADPRVQKEAGSLATKFGYDVDVLAFSGPSADRKFYAEDYHVHHLTYEPWAPISASKNWLGRKIMTVYFKSRFLPTFFGHFVELKTILRKGTLGLIDNEINQAIESQPRVKFRPNFLTPFHYFYRLNRDILRSGISLAPDIVHAHDLDTLLAGYLIKRKTGAKLVYDSHELWTKQGMPMPAIFIKLMAVLEKRLLKRVDAIISVNESIINELKKMYGLKLDIPEIVVYNCPITSSPRLPKKQNKRTVDVLYQGRFAPSRGLEQLVLAARYFNKNIKLYFRCTGEEQVKRDIINLIKRYGLGRKVAILPPAPMHELVKSASFADIGVIPYLPVNKNNELASPNKLFEYMMSGLALAASDLPELRKFVNEWENGVLFNPKSPKNIAKIINRMASGRENLKKMQQNSLLGSKHYNWESQAKKIANLYRELHNV